MNRKRITGIAIVSLAVAGFASRDARAASPRSVTSKGVPVKWDNSQPIVVAFDQGDLGKMKHDAAVALVNKAFQQWTSTSTANISIQVSPTDLGVDVTAANLNTFLGNLDPKITPIIFDGDGGITGPGALAFGGALAVSPDKSTITQGFIVINGQAVDGLFDPDDPTADGLQRAVTRAVGQMLGVGSSDTNDELRFDGNVANNSALPVMYPTTVIGGGSALTLDDQVSLSVLYPATSFNANTGIIAGTVTAADGTTGIQNIDVIARKVDDPVNSVVSAITGVTFRNPTGRGIQDPALRGAFEIHVSPGNYTLEFRPLRQPIGPLGQIVPLPGGDQFYQASSPNVAPANASAATPVKVAAGQTTQVNLVASGKAAPAPQAVTQVKPDDAPATAQLLPLSATVTGNVSTQDPGQIVRDLGAGLRDKIENLYRIVVTERSLLTLYLKPAQAADLDLYVLRGFKQETDTDRVVASAQVRDTGAESVQTAVDPGTYLIGVSAYDNVKTPVTTDYTLSVTTTPLSDQPATPGPVLNQLVVGNVTDTGADVSWLTDLDATGDVIVAMPQQQFGDPTAGKAHHVTVGGLTAGADADATAISQVTDGSTRANLPRVFFRTADSSGATGPAQLSAAVVGELDDSATVTNSILIALAIQNNGGPASGVQITGLTASPGWKLAQPLNGPLSVGGIGSGGSAIVVVRLLRDGTGPAPLATVTGAGTLAGAGGASVNFTISGP